MAAKLEDDYRIVAVKAHAQAHYNDGGWDIVVEAMSDEDIYWVIYKARSSKGAIERMAAHVGVVADVRADVIAAGGGDDELPPGDPTTHAGGNVILEPEAPPMQIPTRDEIAALLKKDVKVTYTITYVGDTKPSVTEAAGKLVSFTAEGKRTKAKTKATGIELSQGTMNMPGFGASPVSTLVSLDAIRSIETI
jgi:hypothetical protein